ncbi:DUF1648 domain-containing protein [Sediminibacterium soli]|uniref:DUF1648 domain-containing protein n=1 Tax=Sediminibacterium soli TaxID=2698829 RepID=UPI00137A9ECB|nr:DUF1648 domain-containing protein [Sediminibacterium soli]NCI45181.1 DUF1648 domain-containing protein [Sediminibacterium soli]
MGPRPRIQLTQTKADRVLEWSGIALLLCLWAFAVFAYSRLPDIIPTHFNFKGVADRSGNKRSIFILPLIGSFLFFLLTLINRFPHIFNYPVSITGANAVRQYTLATRLIRYLKTLLLVLFLIILVYTYFIATGINIHMGTWLIPIIIVFMFVPVLFFVVRSLRSSKSV